MKYYLIAGEKSGDLHASNLMKALQEADPGAEFRFWGGEAMQAVGGKMVKHYRETAFMGVLEVVKNLRAISRFIKECQQDILAYQPDLLILVDYSGFNLRVAKLIKKEKPSLPIHYYISPKAWAWNTKRALKVKARIDQMFVIFPFEVDFYKGFDYEVDYVGNPLLDAIADFEPNPNFLTENQLGEEPIIALLPGSRKQEVIKALDLMLEVRESFADYQFVIAGVGTLPQELYAGFEKQENVKVIYDQTYDLLHVATAAVVTSGTATLETALLGVPEVVVYKTSFVTYWLALLFLKIDYISLVNLILGKEAVRELIQNHFNPQELEEELRAILPGGKKRQTVLNDYQKLQELVGEPGASRRAGELMHEYLVKYQLEFSKTSL